MFVTFPTAPSLLLHASGAVSATGELHLIPASPCPLSGLQVPPAERHWMRAFFDAALLLELQRNEEALAQYLALLPDFPVAYVRIQVPGKLRGRRGAL